MRRAALLLLASLLVFATNANAAYDPVGAGATKLRLDPGFLSALRKSGVKLRAVAPATMRGGTVSFPVSGGKFDPTQGFGTVEHEGALRLEAGGSSLPIRALRLKTTQSQSPFTAKVGGSQLKLARAAKLTVERQGFGERIAVSGLLLSPKLITRLAKKLRIRGALEAGQRLGSATTVAAPETVKVVARNRASLTLDPAFAAKLDSLFVAVNPIFPAEHPGDFTLPIAKGRVAPDGSTGTVFTGGSLELLQLGGGQVFWAEAAFDLGAGEFSAEVEVLPSPPYAGQAGRGGMAGLDLRAARISPQPRTRTIAIEGARLLLSAGAAATFNEVFAKPQGKDSVFVAGETVGSVSLVVQGQ
jgi:hypothetical protein